MPGLLHIWSIFVSPVLAPNTSLMNRSFRSWRSVNPQKWRRDLQHDTLSTRVRLNQKAKEWSPWASPLTWTLAVIPLVTFGLGTWQVFPELHSTRTDTLTKFSFVGSTVTVEERARETGGGTACKRSYHFTKPDRVSFASLCSMCARVLTPGLKVQPTYRRTDKYKYGVYGSTRNLFS